MCYLKGPRQVGKTESVRRFAENSYENVIYINFVEEPKYKLITADGYRTDDIVKNISCLDPGKRFPPGKTLFFFDELQEFPDIATALKFFCIDGRFDVICSGSCWGSITGKSRATAWATKRTTRCIPWILRNFSGQRATMTGSLRIC